MHNFNAGPGVLPEDVLREAQAAIWEHDGSGIGILEMSHRSRAFDAVLASAKDRLRRLLRLSDDQEVLFLHGGARTQFFMIPMNLLRGGRATYLDTGIWAGQALIEARRYGTVDVPFSSRETGYDHLPRPGAWGPLPEGTRYLYYTSNNTVAGTELPYVPEVAPGGPWLICDTSSNFLSQPLDGSRFDLLYGGAQKNVGPAGVTLVILKRALLDHCDPDLPSMLRYGVHVRENSLYNTPCVFGIYMVDRVCAWIERQGGLDAIGARNARRSQRVYATIDDSGFWRGRVEPWSRSRMNITFTSGDPDLDKRFVAEAETHGLLGLKGHKSLGGLRASLYNALPDASVDALVDFLGDFARRYG
ncbi:MAG TPA: 3-phosphoserine/phosphohydroxythreonine transaminase [Myxococcota bacterium]|nr:3-phosphoserine/phosphohydroxythreonine transaminase [Myxococcota bacterium]